MKRQRFALRGPLLHNLLCVLLGLKDAYLVDCCRMTVTDAVKITKEMCDTLKVDFLATFLIVLVAEDVFIAHRGILVSKLERWKNDTGSIGYHFIDLRGSSPVIANDACVEAVRTALRQWANSCPVFSPSIEISQESDIYQGIGGPGLAGLLLGYEFVYFVTPSDGSDWMAAYAHASQLLSYRSLKKVTFQCSLSLPKAASKVLHLRPPDHEFSVRCMEYTYPAEEECSLDASALSNERVSFAKHVLLPSISILAGCKIEGFCTLVSFESQNVSI